jgi:hypothetical protein
VPDAADGTVVAAVVVAVVEKIKLFSFNCYFTFGVLHLLFCLDHDSFFYPIFQFSQFIGRYSDLDFKRGQFFVFSSGKFWITD